MTVYAKARSLSLDSNEILLFDALSEKLSESNEVLLRTPIVVEDEETDFWTQRGFEPRYSRLIEHFEAAPETHMVDPGTRRMIQQLAEATNVEEFADVTDEAIQASIHFFRNGFQEMEHQLNGMIVDMSRIRPIKVHSDYI